MPANAFTLFGTLTIDSSKFQDALNKAESKLKSTKQGLDATEKAVVSLGQTSATSSRNFEKLNTSLDAQSQRVKAAVNAYTSGKLSITQFTSVLNQVVTASDKVANSTKDMAARMTDLKNATDAATQKAKDRATALAKERAELEATKAAAKAKAAAEKALQQAVADSAKAVKAASQSAVQARKQAEQAASNAAKVIKAADKDVERAEAAVAKATQKAADEMASAAKTKQQAMSKFGSQVSSTGDAIKSFGTDMTYLVTVPLAAIAGVALSATIKLDGLRNALTAATGSTDEANNKLAKFMDMSRNMVGVFPEMASRLYAAFKPLGVDENAIDSIIKAFGRLKTAEQNFDPDQFRLNLSQLFFQNFELQDLKQAFTYFPRFGQVVAKQFEFKGEDLKSIQDGFKKLKQQGKLSYSDFVEGIADAVNNDPTLGKLKETFGNQLLKTFERIQFALEPIGNVIRRFLEPALVVLEGVITKLATAFSNLSPFLQDAVIFFGGLIASIGPIAGLIGSVVGIIGALIIALGAIAAAIGTTLLPVFLALVAIIAAVVVALGTLVAAAYALYSAYKTNFGGIRDTIDTTLKVLSSLIDTFINNSLADLKDAFAPITNALDAAGINWTTILLGFEKVVSLTFKAAGDVIQIFAALVGASLQLSVNIFSANVRIIISFAEDIIGVFNSVKSAVKVLTADGATDWNKFADHVRDASDKIIVILTRFYTLIPGLIFGALTKVFPKLNTWANDLIEKMESLGMKLPVAIARGIMKTAEIARKAIDYATKKGETAPDSSDGGGTPATLPNGMAAGAMGKVKPPTVPGIGRVSGGGEKTLSALEQEYKRLEEAIAKVNAVSNVEIATADIMLGKYGKKLQALNDVQRLELLAKEQVLDVAIAEKTTTDYIENLDFEIAKLKEKNIALQDILVLETNQYKNLSQDQKQRIKDKMAELFLLKSQADVEAVINKYKSLNDSYDPVTGKEISEQTKLYNGLNKELIELTASGKGWTDAQKRAAEAGIDLYIKNKEFNSSLAEMKELLKEVNLTFEAMPAAKLTKLLDGSAKSIRLVTELANAANITVPQMEEKIREAVKQITLKEPLSDLTKLMQHFGIATEKAIDWNVELATVLASPDALAAMAEKTGKSVEQLTKEIKKAIDESNNPTFFGQLSKRLDEIRQKTVDWSTAWADSLTNAIGGTIDAFANVFTNWDGTAQGFFKSVAQGFRQMAGQIIAELIKIAAWQMVLKLFGSVAGGLSGGATPGTGTGAATGYTLPVGTASARIGLASGGLVTGAGSGISDSIPAMLSNGEFVIPANVVKTLGVGFFEQLRKGQFSGTAPMPSVSTVSDNRSSSVANSNVFNINVAGGMGGNQTATMVQKEVLKGLQKVGRRNR